MSTTHEVCAADELGTREIVGAGRYAVGRTADGELFALGRRCRHLRADLAEGSLDKAGCLVCPNHGARFETETGKMVRGPQGVPEIVSNLFKALSGWFPQRRGRTVERDGMLFVE